MNLINRNRITNAEASRFCKEQKQDFRIMTTSTRMTKMNMSCIVMAFMLCLRVSNGMDPFHESDNSAAVTLSDEKRLIKKLLDNYETVGIVGRPVNNTKQTISVKYGLSLIQILDLDEKNQVLTTNVWSRYAWDDILLTWEPDDYGGIDLIRVPSSKIWTPDIVLYNYADTRLKEQRDAMVVVMHNGSVIWIPPAIFKSTCQIDITNFPFDVQTCKLKFGSWTYDGYKLDINFLEEKDYVDVDEYMKSNEWELVEYPAFKNVKHYSGLEEPYPDLTFYLKMKRVAAFYNYILILPCVLLSFLTLVIFWLPPESPAKVMLGMSVFVAFFVLLLLLAESTPPAASSIPLIGAYFCMNMILITLSTFLAVIIIQTHIRGDRKNKVPNWLRRVAIDGMARILCMTELLDKDPPKVQERRQGQESTTFHHQKHGDKRTTSSSRATNAEVHFNRHQPSLAGATRASSMPPSAEHPGNEIQPPATSCALENDIKEIRHLLKSYLCRLENKDANAKNAKDWRLVARVLDRLFFFTYVGTIFVSMCTVFPREVYDSSRIVPPTDPPSFV